MSRLRCAASEAHHRHARACRRGRPLCRYRRALRDGYVCKCDGWPFPHRPGSCGDGTPAAIRKSAAYQAENAEHANDGAEDTEGEKEYRCAPLATAPVA